jgi:DNA-directed RNA polymerase subunit M/transcription elongation factor TFIIS
MADDGARAVHKVSCPCGAALRFNPMAADRRLKCPSCGLVLDFVVSVDGRSKRSRVSIVVSPEAVRTEGESLANTGNKEPAPAVEAPARGSTSGPRPKPSGKTIKGVMGTCICGTLFPVDEEELTTIQACPQCGVEYHCVVKIERGSRQRTAILVPVKTAQVRRPSIAPQVLMPATTRTGKRTQLPPPKARSRTAAVPKPPPQIPPGAQAVPCACGEILVVRKKDVSRGMTCPGCGTVHKLQEVPDPQTLIPIIRIRPDSKR